jgi:hypothetical protein
MPFVFVRGTNCRRADTAKEKRVYNNLRAFLRELSELRHCTKR